MVLLHLVGCPRHFQNAFEGIIGVQPWPIVLENLQISDIDTSTEPIWLQDASKQTCLGPLGKFTADCGDATLWLVLRQPLKQSEIEQNSQKRRRVRMGLFAVDEDNVHCDPASPQHPSEGLVFYVVDRDVQDILDLTIHAKRRVWWDPKTWFKRSYRKKKRLGTAAPLECLAHDDNGKVSVQVCDQKSHNIPQSAALPSWGWEVSSEDNSLQPTRVREGKSSMVERDADEKMCVAVHEPTNQLRVSTCVEEDPSTVRTERQIHLSLLRYASVSETTGHPSPVKTIEEQATESRDDQHSKLIEEDDLHIKEREHLTGSGKELRGKSESAKERSNSASNRTTTARTSIRDLAHTAAFASLVEPVSLPPRLLFEHRRQASDGSGSRAKRVGAGLHNSNPILLAGGVTVRPRDYKKTDSLAMALEIGNGHKQAIDNAKVSLHHRTRRIPVHPYIAAAKDEVWTDPQTGLQYPTDLSNYLGHDRKERGRHTLMGFGQYRKGYVIKVYGIAYYVSKRDVLADPFFEKYAEMSADELRNRPEFYDHLRLNPQNFERTIFIKTNMQLSAETIRGSLKADWTMLTDEAKETILESSMKPQPMDKITKSILDDPNNTGRCSCMTITPPEYNADPSCCSRGTELVFTWLKNGDIECRLNGRTVEVFPRPDIAEGIFFEYLRQDQPISPELTEHVVDGFPFLLAPLAQVKGVHIASGVPQRNRGSSRERRFTQVWDDFANSVGDRALSTVGAIQRVTTDTFLKFHRVICDTTRSIGEALRAAVAMAHGFGDAVHETGRQMSNRREEIGKKIFSLQGYLSKLRIDPVRTLKDWVVKEPDVDLKLMQDLGCELDANEPKHSSRERMFGYSLSRWFGDVYYAPADDGIGSVRIHPTINRTRKEFLLLVHLYLLLLLISSFPGSYTTRTRMIRKVNRQKIQTSFSETESDTDSEHEDAKNG